MSAPAMGPRSRWAKAFVMALGVTLLSVSPATGMFSVAAAADTNFEYKVKAAFLFNFARFVTWPAYKFETPESPIDICVLGSDPFDGVLDDTVRDKSINGRPLRVRRALRPDELRRCHVVFSGETDPARLQALLGALAGHAVLTVHEADDTQAGGVVRFLIEDDRVRFEINTAAAARENLQLSAKLLGVARVVLK